MAPSALNSCGTSGPFGDANVIRSSDLVAKLTADPGRPLAREARPPPDPETTGPVCYRRSISSRSPCIRPGSRTGKATAASISRRRGPPTAPIPLRSDLFIFEASKRPNADDLGTTLLEASLKIFWTDRKTPSCPTAMRVWMFRRISRKWAMRSA